MTISVENLHYENLEKILRNPDISEMEANLIIQVCIHIISGNRTTQGIMDVFNMSARNSKTQDELKILNNILNI